MNEYIQNAYRDWLRGTLPPQVYQEDALTALPHLSTRSRKAIRRLAYSSTEPDRPVSIGELIRGETRKDAKQGWEIGLIDMKNFGVVGCHEIDELLRDYCGKSLHIKHRKR